MAANPPPDLQELAKRTGDTPVGDLESVIPRPMDIQGGDLNAPQPARNCAAWWLSDECTKAGFTVVVILAVLNFAAILVCFSLKHHVVPVVKVLAFSCAGLASVALFLLLVGWACGYGTMARTGLWLFHLEFYPILFLYFIVMNYSDKW